MTLGITSTLWQGGKSLFSICKSHKWVLVTGGLLPFDSPRRLVSEVIEHTRNLRNGEQPLGHLVQYLVRHGHGIGRHTIHRLNGTQHNRIARLAVAERNQNDRKLPNFGIEPGFAGEFPNDRVGLPQQFDAAMGKSGCEDAMMLQRLTCGHSRHHAVHSRTPIYQFGGLILQTGLRRRVRVNSQNRRVGSKIPLNADRANRYKIAVRDPLDWLVFIRAKAPDRKSRTGKGMTIQQFRCEPEFAANGSYLVFVEIRQWLYNQTRVHQLLDARTRL